MSLLRDVWRGKIRCHACNRASPYWSSSGIRNFSCAACGADNFLDAHGEITDPPEHIVQQSRSQRAAFSAVSAKSNDSVTLCETCQRNQNILYQSLANYLPDEDDPRYAQFEAQYPSFKRDLESRYPPICKACAPKAQASIRDADYYSLSSSAGQLMGIKSRRLGSPSRARRRDSKSKFASRIVLDIIGSVAAASVMYQLGWHMYNMYGIITGEHNETIVRSGRQGPGSIPVKPSQCLEAASHLAFNQPCFALLSSAVRLSLWISLLLIWYNNRLRDLFHPVVRYTSINNWRQYLIISAFILIVRLVAYTVLSDSTFIAKLTTQQLLAAHGAVIAVILIAERLTSSALELEKWRMNGTIMPRPEDQDVLGQFAGPAAVNIAPQVSVFGPRTVLNSQFPIENLAPRRSARLRESYGGTLPPSPPGSDMGDPMDIEPTLPSQTTPKPAQSFNGFASWEGVRTNLFSIEDEMRAKVEQNRKPNIENDDKFMYIVPPSQKVALRGRMPHAPMSQERRLRNPIAQVQFKEPLPSEQKDFLHQMRSGFDAGRGFGAKGGVDTGRASGAYNDNIVSTRDDGSLSPAKGRTRGQLDLQSSGWHLASDSASTGLEESFRGGLRIGDPIDQRKSLDRVPGNNTQHRALLLTGAVLVAIAGAAVAANFGQVRVLLMRPLVNWVEGLGL